MTITKDHHVFKQKIFTLELENTIADLPYMCGTDESQLHICVGS